MKIDAGINGNLADIPTRAKELEAQGYDGLISAELANDPFFPLLLAAEHTERVQLMTSIRMEMSSSGRLEPATWAAQMASNTSRPSMTRPNTVYCMSRWGVPPSSS